MNILSLIILVLIIMNINFGQDAKFLLADGTENIPKKYDLQPNIADLSNAEIEVVKKIALEREVMFENLNPQMSSEESNFRQDFELLDVAEGFFISREIESRAYLYTAYSQKMKRNYQGIIVLSISQNGAKFTPKAHYAYQYRGDKFIRLISDLNGNFLSELAIFSQPPPKTIIKKYVRLLEFSPDGLIKLGETEIYSYQPQKQRTPWNRSGNPPDKRIYIPPVITAKKLYYQKRINQPFQLFTEKWRISGGNRVLLDEQKLIENGLEEDLTEYIEVIKSEFPIIRGEISK